MAPRKTLRARFTAATALALASALMAACGGGSVGGDVEDGTLHVALSAEVIDLPIATAATSATMVTTMVHRGLTAFDADGEVIPALAESYSQTNERTFEFKLRPDIEFHDGTPLTSELVKKSLDFYTSTDSGSRAATVLSPFIDSIDAPDESTIVFNLKRPFVALPEYLAVPGMSITPPDTLSAGTSAWVGIGPFAVIEHDDSGITLKKNEDYYGAKDVELDRIEVKFIEDATARANALIDGSVDLIDYVDTPDIERLRNTDGIAVDTDEETAISGGSGLYLTFNVTEKPLSEPLVRQAIALAINRDNIVQAALDGYGASRASVLPAGSEFANPTLDEAWTYDPERAKQLLAQAGYADGFNTTFLTTAQYSYHQDAAVSIQADLAKIGIEATLDNPDFAARMDKGAKGQFGIQINGNFGAVNDPSYLVDWVSGPPAGFKSFGFDDPQLNKVLNDAMAASGEEQVDLYRDAQQLIVEQTPFTSLVTLTTAFARKDNVEGFSILPNFTSKYAGYTIENMRVG